MSREVRRALYGKLAGDTILNGGGTVVSMLGGTVAGYGKSIYHDSAPSAAQFPFIVMNKQVGTPTYAFGDLQATAGTAAVFDSDIWMIKAVDNLATADRAEQISARVQALLNDGSLSISGARQLYLRRESDLEYEEVVDGVTYHHVGSLYRLIYD